MPDPAPTTDLAVLGAPIAAALLPGWRIRWVPVTREEMDEGPAACPGALACVSPLPERQLATVRVVLPVPAGESLAETLWHELTHVLLSPLTALIPANDGVVMLEEHAVERLSVLLSQLPMAARRAVVGAVERWAPRLRARIAARAPLARGGTMDPKMVTEALEALIGGDSEKCAEILKGMIAQAAGGTPPATEPDGDEGANAPDEVPPMDAKAPRPPAAGPSPAPTTPAEPAAARTSSRLAAVDGEHTRARKAADAATSIAVRARLREIRQDGIKLPTNLETELAKMVDLDAFERRVGDLLAGRALAAPGGTRARAQAEGGGPVQHGGAPPPNEEPAPPVDADTLRAEGATDQFIANYAAMAKSNPSVGAALLAGFRDPTAIRARQRNGFGRPAAKVS